MCVLGKNTPTAKSARFCQSELPAKWGFFKSLSTISQIKIKEEVGASLCSQFMSMGIMILHLNKIERLPRSLRRTLETTGWCVLALWKMSSSLIPGTVFISNPSQGLDFANRCSNAELDSPGISNSLHMQGTEGEEHRRRVEEHKPQRSGPLWWWKQVTQHTRTQSSIQNTFCSGLWLMWLLFLKGKLNTNGWVNWKHTVKFYHPTLGYFDI